MALHFWRRKISQSPERGNSRISSRIVLSFLSFRSRVSALLKRASAMTYSASEKAAIVADKTGEMYSFPWPLSPEQRDKYNHTKTLPPTDTKNPLTKATDERFLGTFLLGHSSSVVSVVLAKTKWGRVLVSGDRDEHVRISLWPETWVIWGMGLGHEAFVSCLAGIDGGVVSGGGDLRVIKWDFEGVKKGEHTISKGSCVRLLKVWQGLIVAVGERFVSFASGWLIVDLR